jgi:hypothetical protein
MPAPFTSIETPSMHDIRARKKTGRSSVFRRSLSRRCRSVSVRTRTCSPAALNIQSFDGVRRCSLPPCNEGRAVNRAFHTIRPSGSRSARRSPFRGAKSARGAPRLSLSQPQIVDQRDGTFSPGEIAAAICAQRSMTGFELLRATYRELVAPGKPGGLVPAPTSAGHPIAEVLWEILTYVALF